MKKNQSLFLGGLAVVVLVLVVAVLTGLAGGRRATPATPGGSVVPPVKVNPTEAALKEESNRVINEGGIIPYDYKVLSVSETEARVGAEQGEATLPNDPLVSVFRRVGTTDTPATFADLKVGQKLVLERAVPPSKELKVFIVSE